MPSTGLRSLPPVARQLRRGCRRPQASVPLHRGQWRPSLPLAGRPARGGRTLVATIKLTHVIRRPIDEVFDVLVDAGNFADWNPTIRASRQLDEGEIGEGSRFEWDLRGFGK